MEPCPLSLALAFIGKNSCDAAVPDETIDHVRLVERVSCQHQLLCTAQKGQDLILAGRANAPPRPPDDGLDDLPYEEGS